MTVVTMNRNLFNECAAKWKLMEAQANQQQEVDGTTKRFNCHSGIYEVKSGATVVLAEFSLTITQSRSDEVTGKTITETIFDGEIHWRAIKNGSVREMLELP